MEKCGKCKEVIKGKKFLFRKPNKLYKWNYACQKCWSNIINKKYIKMDKDKLAEFNKELKELLAKYDVSLTVEDVPATKRIAVVSNKKETSEVTGTDEKETKPIKG